MELKTIKNYAYNLSYQILVILAPLVTTPYVSRVLHSDGLGVYSYTATIATAFSLVAALGVNSYGQREIAYRQDDEKARSKVFWELFFLRAIVSLVCVVAYVGFSLWYQQYSPYLLIQLFAVLAVLLDISWFFQGMEDFRLIAIRNAAVKLASIALIFLLVKTENDVIVYCAINAISMAAGNLLFFVGLNKRVRRVPLKELDLVQHVPGTMQFFIPIIATQIYSQLDKILLGAILNDAVQSGYYEQVRKIVNLSVTLVTSLNSVLYSRNAHLFAQGDHEGVRRSMRESFMVICMIMLPLVVGIFCVANNFVGWFFGPEFGPCAPLLKLSCPLILFMCVGNFVGMQYLAPTGLQNKMTMAYLTAAAVDVVANFLLIPRLYATGALLASLAAELCSCGLQVWMLLRSDYKSSVLKGALPYALAAVLMGGVLFAWQSVSPLSGGLQTLTEVALGGTVYFVLISLCKGTIINQFIRRRFSHDEHAGI